MRRSAFFDSSGEFDSSRVTFTVEPEVARRGRPDAVGAGGLEVDVRLMRVRVERRIGIMMRCFQIWKRKPSIERNDKSINDDVSSK